MTPRPAGDDAGFSLVEVLAALAVLMVVSVAVAGGLMTAARTSATSKSRTAAAALAAQEVELARSLPQSALVLGTAAAKTQTVDGRTYTITRTVAWGSSAGTVNRCSGAGTGRYAFRRVSVVVTWAGMVGATPITNETLIAPPGGSGTPDSDSQRVHVVDAGGQPVSDVTAVLTGTTTSPSQLTDKYGCAVFLDVAPGTYTVAVSRTGYVDPNGAATSTRTLTVAGTDTPPLAQLQLDRTSGVVITPTTPNAAYPIPAGLGGTVSNTSMTSTRSATSATATTTISGLFPFKNSSYLGWAGTCTDGNPAWHGSAATAPVKVAAGSTPVLSTPTMPVTGKIKTGNGSPFVYSSKIIYVVHAATGCTTSLANPGVSGGTVGAVIALTTDSSGVFKASIPYGVWHLEPPAGSGYKATSSFTIAPPGCASPSVCNTSPTASDVNIY